MHTTTIPWQMLPGESVQFLGTIRVPFDGKLLEVQYARNPEEDVAWRREGAWVVSESGMILRPWDPPYDRDSDFEAAFQQEIRRLLEQQATLKRRAT